MRTLPITAKARLQVIRCGHRLPRAFQEEKMDTQIACPPAGKKLSCTKIVYEQAERYKPSAISGEEAELRRGKRNSCPSAAGASASATARSRRSF